MKPRWQKQCPTCGQSLCRDGYYRDATRPHSLSRLCKTCHRARMQRYWKETYYPAHRAQLIAAAMERKQANKESRAPRGG